MMENDYDCFFLLEGPLLQGKSTFGISLYNELLQNSKKLPFYIPLDISDPDNIFQNLDKCSWTNFESILHKYKSSKIKLLQECFD